MKEILNVAHKSDFIKEVIFHYNGKERLIKYVLKNNNEYIYKANNNDDFLEVYINTYFNSPGNTYNKLVKNKMERFEYREIYKKRLIEQRKKLIELYREKEAELDKIKKNIELANKYIRNCEM